MFDLKENKVRCGNGKVPVPLRCSCIGVQLVLYVRFPSFSWKVVCMNVPKVGLIRKSIIIIDTITIFFLKVSYGTVLYGTVP